MGNNKEVDYAYHLKPGHKIDLKDFDPDYTGGLDKEDAVAHFQNYSAELGEQQELLYTAAYNRVLVVLQGMDTSGKDGAIRHVMGMVNPQGCQVTSFKVPTSLELSHDFLWRVHAAVPPKGMLGIFNRSHYEDVLVVPVHKLKPSEVVESYYEHINNFEKLLADSGCIVLKFFLHISKDEQKERLLEREKDPTKQYKVAAGDWREREHWEEYQGYYEEALTRCNTGYAPWYIVPANKKWYRNLAIAETIVERLRPYHDEWEKALLERGKAAMEELQEARKSGEIGG
jgi:PPK2 family polyphosphate:nucleotide phosphotransferase